MRDKKAFEALKAWAQQAEDFDRFYDGLTHVLQEYEAKRVFQQHCSYSQYMQCQAKEFWNRFRKS